MKKQIPFPQVSIELDRDYTISVGNKGINYDQEKGVVVNRNKSMLRKYE